MFRRSPCGSLERGMNVSEMMLMNLARFKTCLTCWGFGCIRTPFGIRKTCPDCKGSGVHK